MECGYCGGPGHTICTCSAPGIEEGHQKLASDPKYLAQKERAAAKRAERHASEGRRLQLSTDPQTLHDPEVKPGVIKEEFGEKAKNIRGAIDLALPKEYLLKILRAIHENQ